MRNTPTTCVRWRWPGQHGIATAMLLAGLLAIGVTSHADERPNVVLIMTDNHGPWTLGCYGNSDILTPNIDRLAREGVRLSRCFSSNAVCSPTRATFLTGLMPSQHGVHNWLARGNLQIGPRAYSTIAEFRTLGEILADAGYQCGLVGKWHLGDNLRPQEGFSFWVTKPHGHTLGFYKTPVIEDGTVRPIDTYATEYWTSRGVEFIERHRDDPFFLLLTYNGPYGLGPAMARPARNRHGDHYAEKPMQSFPRAEVHPWLRSMRDYVNNVAVMRRYAAEVSGVDDGVGRVMAALDRLGLERRTVVIFTADQGLCGGHHGMWGMADHSRPLHTFDETAHIPMIWSQPGRIPGHRVLDMLNSNYDLMPTLLGYLGLNDQMPQTPPSPGRDYSPALLGQGLVWDNVVFYEYQNSRMVRTPEWKYTWRFPDGPNELYHLSADPDEQHNLVDDRAFADRRQRMHDRLTAFFDRYADPRYDLAREGGSKTHLFRRGAKRLPPPHVPRDR